LYAFVGNGPVGGWDVLGRDWWIKRNGLSQALAIPRRNDDTFESLAATIHLDYEERTKWLTRAGSPVSADDEAERGCVYGVPNVLAMYTSKKSWMDVHLATVERNRGVVEILATAYEDEGYSVVFKERWSDKTTFINLWQIDGIYGIFFAGHGGYLGLFVAPDADEEGDRVVFPTDVSPPYKLAFGIFYACDSDRSDDEVSGLGSWRDHIAIDAGASFLGYSGLEWWHTTPNMTGEIAENSNR
jgi:hypothetical protein